MFCRPNSLIRLALLLACIAMSSISCAQPRQREIPEPPAQASEQVPLAASETPLPDYLQRVWPAPGTRASVQESNQDFHLLHFPFVGDENASGLAMAAILRVEEVAEEGDTLDIDWAERCSLLVDGLALEEDPAYSVAANLIIGYSRSPTRELYRVGGPYYLQWQATMAPGAHRATLRVEKTSGAVLEYSWEFEIAP